MNMGKKFLSFALFVGASIVSLGNSPTQAAVVCALKTTPAFYKVTYYPISSSSFKMYVEINSCSGMGTGSLGITDTKGNQVKFLGKPGRVISDGMPSRGSVLEGFEYQISGLETGSYSFSLNGWRENATGANPLSSKSYGKFSWNSTTGSVSQLGSPTSSIPVAIVPSGNATIDACNRLPSDQQLSCRTGNTNTAPPTTKPLAALPAIVSSGSAALDACNRLPSNQQLSCKTALWKSTSSTAAPTPQTTPPTTKAPTRATTRATTPPTTKAPTRATTPPTTKAPVATTVAPPTTRPTTAPTTTKAPVATTTAPTTLAPPTNTTLSITNESYSVAALRGTGPWVTYTVSVNCGTGCTTLPTTIAGRLCVTGRSFEDATCTGAIMGSSGSSTQRTYSGLFGFGGSPDTLLRSSYLHITVNSQIKSLNGSKTIAWTN